MTEPHQDAVPRRRFIGPIVLVLGITLVTGAVHGRFMQRWGPAPDLLAAARHLDTFPQQMGDWQLLKKEPMDESTVQMLSCAGYVNNRYQNRKTGDEVGIAIMLGPSGPISVHTPEVCYSSRAYAIQEPRQSISLSGRDGRPHTFWSLLFRTNTPSTDRLRVCYAWRGEEAWEASSNPRFEFAGRPFLFKLQIASLVPSDQADASHNPCADFLSAMLLSGWRISG